MFPAVFDEARIGAAQVYVRQEYSALRLGVFVEFQPGPCCPAAHVAAVVPVDSGAAVGALGAEHAAVLAGCVVDVVGAAVADAVAGAVADAVVVGVVEDAAVEPVVVLVVAAVLVAAGDVAAAAEAVVALIVVPAAESCRAGSLGSPAYCLPSCTDSVRNSAILGHIEERIVAEIRPLFGEGVRVRVTVFMQGG